MHVSGNPSFFNNFDVFDDTKTSSDDDLKNRPQHKPESPNKNFLNPPPSQKPSQLLISGNGNGGAATPAAVGDENDDEQNEERWVFPKVFAWDWPFSDEGIANGVYTESKFKINLPFNGLCSRHSLLSRSRFEFDKISESSFCCKIGLSTNSADFFSSFWRLEVETIKSLNLLVLIVSRDISRHGTTPRSSLSGGGPKRLKQIRKVYQLPTIYDVTTLNLRSDDDTILIEASRRIKSPIRRRRPPDSVNSQESDYTSTNGDCSSVEISPIMTLSPTKNGSQNQKFFNQMETSEGRCETVLRATVTNAESKTYTFLTSNKTTDPSNGKNIVPTSKRSNFGEEQRQQKCCPLSSFPRIQTTTPAMITVKVTSDDDFREKSSDIVNDYQGNDHLKWSALKFNHQQQDSHFIECCE